MRRWAVPAVPFVFSLCLSAATVGTHPYWQDSGLYLTAVREFGVLYPPGFVLYEVLCKLWTVVFGFVDFILAVHLFSSLCAALAAGTVAVAARDLLRSRGRLFQVTDADPGDLAEACGMLAGVAIAAGFTFWSTAIYAKGYPLYYLILALLLWRMIRADESGKPRDFIGVAVLIGLSWQAHPSAALIGVALLLFVGAHARTLGAKRVLVCVAVAAACALGPSLLLLPWLHSRDPWLVMGEPTGPIEALSYATGRRYVSIPGVFGVDATRVASFGKFLWEEFLGVGLALVAAGLLALTRRNKRLLIGVAAWTLPYAVITVLFKIEGQHDCWFVAAWMPLYLAAGVGALQLALWSGSRARPALAAAGIVMAGWSLAANVGDVSQRNYTLAESYGRSLLDPVDRDAVLLLAGDDSNALVSCLQRVRGERPDVVLVTTSFLDMDSGAYEARLQRRHPFLRLPDYGPLRLRAERRDAAIASFLNANAEAGRPLFSEKLVPPELIRPDYALIPAGVSWKLVRREPLAALDARYWSFPVEPEKIDVRARRARGQKVTVTPGGIDVQPQRYEERLRSQLVLARFHLAMAQTERGQFAPAARLCESIMALDPEYWSSPDIVHILAISLYAAGERMKADLALRRSVEIGSKPSNRATASFYLGELARARGDEAQAREWFDRALSVPGLDEGTRRQIESRMKSK